MRLIRRMTGYGGITMSSHEELRRAPPIIIIITRLRDGTANAHGADRRVFEVLKKLDE